MPTYTFLGGLLLLSPRPKLWCYFEAVMMGALGFWSASSLKNRVEGYGFRVEG